MSFFFFKFRPGTTLGIIRHGRLFRLRDF